MAWVKPTGYTASAWQNEQYAYDDNLGTWAGSPSISPLTWTTFLELTHANMYCSKVRYYSIDNAANDQIDIDVY